MPSVAVAGGAIRLGQLLKLAGVLASGSEARALLALGVVCVNGEVETRRGRQVVPGDLVEVDGETITVVAAEEP